MPSDERVLVALEAVRPAAAAYRRAIAAAADRVASYLPAPEDESVSGRAAAELGEFAAERMDARRFAGLLDGRPLDDAEQTLVRKAHGVLRELESTPDVRFHLDVPAGGSLSFVVDDALGQLGRAFGAAVVVELARSGRYVDAEHQSLFHGLPHRRWNRAERQVAPPLVVTIDGADMWVGSVARHLDGAQKLLLVVRPPCPPAPLVRLITPGILVAQTSKVDALGAWMRVDDPAVVAFVPEGAAEFVHLPDAGRTVQERLTVSVLPAGPIRPVESWSVWQQQQDLMQLAVLATASAARPETGNGSPAATDPVDRLAAWLLAQAQPGPAGGGT